MRAQRFERFEAILIRKMSGWQSAAHYRWETELVEARRLSARKWSRRRIGRPPHKWEAPMALAWGDMVPRSPQACCGLVWGDLRVVAIVTFLFRVCLSGQGTCAMRHTAFPRDQAGAYAVPHRSSVLTGRPAPIAVSRARCAEKHKSLSGCDWG